MCRRLHHDCLLIRILRFRLRRKCGMRSWECGMEKGMGGFKGKKSRATKLSAKKREAIAKRAAIVRWKSKNQLLYLAPSLHLEGRCTFTVVSRKSLSVGVCTTLAQKSN